MRTGRSLTVCCSLLPGEVGFSLPGPRGVCLVQGGSCLVRGGSPCQVPGGFLPGPGGGSPCQVPGGSAWSGGGFSLPGPGGVLPARSRGGSPCQVLGGVCQVPGGLRAAPPPVNRITHTCKNITFATTSLRPVKTHVYKPCYLQTSSTLNTMQHWRVSIQISLLVKSGFLLLWQEWWLHYCSAVRWHPVKMSWHSVICRATSMWQTNPESIFQFDDCKLHDD